jgi:hypothetical protein
MKKTVRKLTAAALALALSAALLASCGGQKDPGGSGTPTPGTPGG